MDKDAGAQKPQTPAEVSAGDTATTARPTKTPMYSAMHAARYQRQAMIREICRRNGRPLICYISGINTGINRDDTVFLVDLLHNVARGSDLDLMLHSGGGDIDAAEKLISLVRTCVAVGQLRVIVPDFAKSAATLMALGADRVVMSESSELGPIDPQVDINDGRGNVIRHSIQSYLDAYESHADALRTNPADVAASIMLSKLEPATVKLFEAVRDRARSFAEDQLKRGMFRATTGNFTSIAAMLMDTRRWLTHGQMIGWRDASQIGLTVEHLDELSEEWQGYWRLYCLQRLEIKDRGKLFESEFASLVVEG